MDETTETTRDKLLEAKLEIVRTQMAAGFERLEKALAAHAREDEEAHRRIDVMAERVRQLELEAARESTKLKIIAAAMSLGGGGAGALLSKFVL